MSSPVNWQKNKEDINRVYSQRVDKYQALLVRCVISKDGGTWRNLITRIEGISKKEKLQKDETLDYDDVIAAKRVLSTTDLEKILTGLDSDIIRLSDLPDYRFHISNVNNIYDRYNSSRDPYFNIEWPSNCYHVECPSDERKHYTSRRSLVKPNTVLFPSIDELAINWCDLDFVRYGQFWNSLLFIIPNFRLRINELRIGLGSLFLSLEFNDLDLRDVIGKVYLEDNSGAIEQLDFEVTDLEFTLNTRVEPEKVLVHLLSKSTGEVLDYRRIYLSWREFPKGVTLDRWGSDFMDIIKNGESQTTELKREVGNSPRGIIETIIAFSNSYGGLIFIGVDDDTEIYGINDKGIRDQITNAIADCCDPPIIPEIYTINLEGKDVVVIEVEEGDDKPYTFRNRGIFVRRNGTTRIASRFEYDSLNSKNRNYPYNPL